MGDASFFGATGAGSFKGEVAENLGAAVEVMLGKGSHADLLGEVFDGVGFLGDFVYGFGESAHVCAAQSGREFYVAVDGDDGVVVFGWAPNHHVFLQPFNPHFVEFYFVFWFFVLDVFQFRGTFPRAIFHVWF